MFEVAEETPSDGTAMLKRTVLTLSAVVLLVSPAAAQEWAEKMFESRSHDFGTIARGAKAEYEFVLKNIYVKDVHIASVQVSCGCTTPRIKQPLLRTYEEGAVVASINSDKFTGRQSSTITVTIDKPMYARVQLHVKVYIQPDVVVDPPAVRLGEIDQGTGAENKVTVTCTRRSNWRIVEVKSANPHLSGEVVETSRSGGRVSYELRVRLDESAPTGYIKDYLVLVTNDNRSIQIPVTVEGRVLSAVTVSPASLFFGVVQPGHKVTKQVVVRSKKPFRITSITADCECFEFGTPDEDVAKPLHLVPVTFAAGEKPGKVAKTIRIKTDLDDATVELSAIALVTQK